MSLNLRDCSAGNLEVDTGLVWGGRGNATCYAGKTLCQNSIIPQVMALGCGTAVYGVILQYKSNCSEDRGLTSLSQKHRATCHQPRFAKNGTHPFY